MIIWLASYPKSGNTWLRSLLSSYYFSRNGEFNFELLKKIDQFPSVNYFKNDKDLYLKPEDTAEKWLDKQAEINREKKLRLFKTHNAICKINGNRFTDPKNTLGGIYICLLYTSDAADDTPCVDLGGRRIIKKISRVAIFFFQAEDGIRDVERSRGLGDVYKRQITIIQNS